VEGYWQKPVLHRSYGANDIVVVQDDNQDKTPGMILRSNEPYRMCWAIRLMSITPFLGTALYPGCSNVPVWQASDRTIAAAWMAWLLPAFAMAGQSDLGSN
jgi:hypothetical protein